METIQLTADNTLELVAKAADVLRSGGVVLFPTDTLYGLATDAFSDSAVDTIYKIKGRTEGKPVHAIVSDLDMARTYGIVTDTVERLAAQLPTGKITFIVRKKPGLDTGICRGIETFGFRIPDNEFCIALAKAFGPYTATSANKAGEKPLRTVPEILLQLGASQQDIDLVIDAEEIPESLPSTVIDVSSGSIKILREGAIPSSAIF